MDVKALIVDPIANMPVVILRDEEEKNFLPIWVGVFEANAIALQMEGVTTPRPMTHDLLKNLITQIEGDVRAGRHQQPQGKHVLRPDPPQGREQGRARRQPSVGRDRAGAPASRLPSSWRSRFSR